MSSGNNKSAQNILTAVIAGVAVLLAVVVLLVKTGVLKQKEETTTEAVLDSTVVVASETMENGDVVYYTMVDYYVKPGISSFYVYPTTEPPSTSETESAGFIEETEIVQATDAEGYLLVDSNGVPLTQVVVHTIPVTEGVTEESTTEFVPRTEYAVVTNKLHQVKKDENGNPITELVTLDPYPTQKPDYWSEKESGTTADSSEEKKHDVSKDEALASSIVGQINEDRTAQGLAPLSAASDLKALASSRCMFMVFPDLYTKLATPSKTYTFTTDYGGKALYNDIASSAGDSALSPEVSKIGAAVVKYNNTYYTTVIFK